MTPAAIVLLDSHLDALDLRRLMRRPAVAPPPIEQTLWHRLAMVAMRTAVPIGVAGAPWFGRRYRRNRFPGNAVQHQGVEDMWKTCGRR
ncbi:hypothetical protein FPZ47_17650 [Mycobacterium helveticum]|uniref:Uncharacterized protein n=1 Tax=Mycobacterium helveticum TaxID=2592811 RepID=A0A557XLE6_9MYCO|nr:hypothetical protein FPZ47_17650 [Mycobacterium helveticum]